MSIIRFIKKYFEETEQQKIQYLETKKRKIELSQTLNKIVNIDLFGRKNIIKEETPINSKNNDETLKLEQDDLQYVPNKEREEQLVKTMDKIVNINIFEHKKEIETKKINIIEKINLEKMTANQLKNTYSCIKKSIKQAETRNKLDDIEELKQLKVQVKKILLEKSNNLDFNSIKYNILYGDVNKLDYYREYLLGCYEHYKNIQHNNEAHQMRITILTLLKLIERKKQKVNNNQYVKKVA